jgi:hypothetical protein
VQQHQRRTQQHTHTRYTRCTCTISVLTRGPILETLTPDPHALTPQRYKVVIDAAAIYANAMQVDAVESAPDSSSSRMRTHKTFKTFFSLRVGVCPPSPHPQSPPLPLVLSLAASGFWFVDRWNCCSAATVTAFPLEYRAGYSFPCTSVPGPFSQGRSAGLTEAHALWWPSFIRTP